MGAKFPEVKEGVAQDAVIDGEIVALDDKGRSSFQLLQGFDIGLVKPPIVFYAFDLLRLNGKDLQNLPIEGFRLANHMVGAEGAPALGLVIRISGRTTPPALVR